MSFRRYDAKQNTELDDWQLSFSDNTRKAKQVVSRPPISQPSPQMLILKPRKSYIPNRPAQHILSDRIGKRRMFFRDGTVKQNMSGFQLLIS